MVELTLPSLQSSALANALRAVGGASGSVVVDVLLEMLDRADAAISVKDMVTGRYTFVNTRYAALFGHVPAAMQGQADADLMAVNEAAAMRAGEQAAVTQTLPTVSEQRIERAGSRREFTVTRIMIRPDESGAARHVCAMWLEQTAMRQREARLQQALAQLEQQQRALAASRTEHRGAGVGDAETPAYETATFTDQLRREVDLSSRESREFALVAVALDPLSQQVVERGPQARERVLDALGHLIRHNTRAMDSSCRLSDDRFAVLLSGVGLATAHSRMEGLRRQCATQIVALDGHDLGFSVSMGVASFPHTAGSRDELMRACDAALDDARRHGGNHVALARIKFDQIAPPPRA